MEHRSLCPVSSALDVFGDKWTLLVLRMIFAGRTRYADILAMPERISTNILAERLAMLECNGLIRKMAYQERPKRYEYRLTERGADTLPVLQTMAIWARKHIPDRWQSPEWFDKGVPGNFYPAGDAS